MSAPSTPGRGQDYHSWQEKLQNHCRLNQYPAPVFNILSDRRGGRTAWSSTVLIPNPQANTQQLVQARYWYDGQHVNNAKEDAAEVALRLLSSNSPSSSSGGSSAMGSRSAGSPPGGGPSMPDGWSRSPPTVRR